MKKKVYKAIAYLMSSIIILGLFAFVLPKTESKAKTIDDTKAIVIGTDVFKENFNTENAPILYFDSNKHPWYVVGIDGSGVAGESGKITLLSRYVFDTEAGPYSHGLYDSIGNSNHYASSELKIRMDNISKKLTKGELTSVTTRDLLGGNKNHDESGYDSDKISGPDVLNAVMWPLSEYEYKLLCSGLRITNLFDSSSGKVFEKASWALRSPGNASCRSTRVFTDGQLLINYDVSEAGYSFDSDGWPGGLARPTFYLDLSSIIFISSAENGKLSNDDSSTLTKVNDYDGNEWKATLKDISRNTFSVKREGDGKVELGDNLSFSYENANYGTNEYISAILFDSNEKVISYGRILNVTDSSLSAGTASVTIPSDLNEGETYTLKFLSEQYNGDKLTDLASEFDDSRNISFTTKRTPKASDFVVSVTNKIYDGTVSEATVSIATGVSGIGTPIVEYYDIDKNKLASAPKEPGTYKVKLNVPAGLDYSAEILEDDSWKYTISTRDYNVTLNSNGGTINSNDVISYEYQKGAMLPTKNDILNIGYTFAGWFDNEKFTGTAIDSITSTDSGDKVFFAKWNPNAYIVIFDSNDGSGSTDTQDREYDDKKSLKGNSFANDGHAFSGWNTQADGNGTSYANESLDNLTSENGVTVTLYAQWDAVFYDINISDDGNGTANASATSGIKGTNIKLEATPNEGFKFAGWETISGEANIKDVSAASTTLAIGTSDVEVMATFEEITEESKPQPGFTELTEPGTEDLTDPEPDPEIPEKDWLDDLRLQLQIANELGGQRTVTYSGDFALSYDIMLYLVEHPDITLIYTVTYEGVDYTITISGGSALADPNIEWYGPLWLLANYGGDKVPEVLAGSGKYTVVAGDTLSGIAAKFNTTVEELVRKNGIENPNYIIVGQVIVY